MNKGGTLADLSSSPSAPRQHSHSLVSNSNLPVVDESYASERDRPVPFTQERCQSHREALSEYNIIDKNNSSCPATQKLSCASKYFIDHLQTRFAENEVENNVIHATMFDRFAPSPKHLDKLAVYVLQTDDGSHGAEVAKYMLKRMLDGNSIVVAKLLILVHRLITCADTRFILPLKAMKEDANFREICNRCKNRATGGPKCDRGAALPLLDVYGAYLDALSIHILNITSLLGTNIFKEKAHNNNFLQRMEMDASMAALVKQSTEVLMIIATVPVTQSLFDLEITKVLFSSLIIDALCLYGFDSKALEVGFIQRKGTKDKAGLQRWMRAFQAYETAGLALNRFFDSISALRIKLPIHIPTLRVPAEGTASKIRAGIANILSGVEPIENECTIDYALANAQTAAQLEAPESVCEKPIFKKKKAPLSSIDTSTVAQSDSGALTNSNPSETSSSGYTQKGGAITGFHVPKDASDYTLQREITTFMSEVNTLDSVDSTLAVDVTATDPLRSPNSKNKEDWQSRFTDEAAESRFVVFSEDVLGKGSYGTVFKAWDETEGRHVACKQINRHRSRHQAAKTATATNTIDEVDTSLRGEFQVLTSLQHENVVSVFAFEALPTVSRIFMEWVPGGSVQDVLKRTGKGLSLSVVRKYITCALKGLAYVHEKHLVHRDVKPGNMLVDSAGNVKLTDFGTSKILEAVVAADDVTDSEGSRSSHSSAATKSIVGTVPYLAPENFQGYYGTQSDIWALGASAVHMYTGKVPWSEKGYTDTLQLIFCIGNSKAPNHHPSYVANVQGLAAPKGDFLSFLDACFTYDKDSRPSAAELLQHPFIVHEARTPV